MATQTGGYPSLTSILQTMQLYLNDWQAGATQTPGEGSFGLTKTLAVLGEGVFVRQNTLFEIFIRLLVFHFLLEVAGIVREKLFEKILLQ